MSKFAVQLKFDREAREKLLEGMEVVYKAVSKTLSPKGRNVAINQPGVPPRVIHDGVGVAKTINLEGHFEDMGAQLLKEASLQTGKEAGDGTTTSTIIAYNIAKKGNEMVTAGYNPMLLKDELNETSKFVIEKLKELSKPIKTKEEMTQVAVISAGDKEMGTLVADVVSEVGKDGLVTIEESRGVDTYVEYKKGFEFDRGFSSKYFVTKEDEAIIEEPYILITDIKINNSEQIVPFLENLLKKGVKNLVIIGDVQEEALSTLVLNKLKGNLNVVAVQVPGYGENQLSELEDIAILTGGVVISKDTGREIKSVVPEELGRATKFVATIENSKIIGGKGNEKLIKTRIKEIEDSIKITKAPYNINLKKSRLSRLSGTVAIIYVGAHSDPELSDRKERIDDALNATKSAVEEGIVAGGEITLLCISQDLEWPKTSGGNILKEAIKSPFEKLVENAGYNYAEVWGKLSPLEYPYGIDVSDGNKKNMIRAGVIDPTKVVRIALEKAVSVAGMCLTTEVLISEPYKEDENK
jgi:chaperonin GroEL